MTVPIPVELRSRNMAELAYPDIQAYLEKGALVLVPIASTEQHGPHLPLCTDTVTAVQVASRVAAINNMMHTPATRTRHPPHPDGAPGRRARRPAAEFEVRRRAQPHSSRIQQDRVHQRARLEREGRRSGAAQDPL